MKRILKSERTSKALLGVSISEFGELVGPFEECVKAQRYKIKPDRKRKLGGGKKGSLPTI